MGAMAALYPTYVHFVSNRSLLLITAWVVANLAWFGLFYVLRFEQAWNNNAVGRALAHVNCLNLGLLLLPVSRGSPLLHRLGVAFERALFYHRLLARAFLACALLHAASWACYWAGLALAPHGAAAAAAASCGTGLAPAAAAAACASTSAAYLLDVGGLAACAALGLFLAMGALAAEAVRRARFELFYYCHHAFLLAVPLALLHALYAQLALYGLATDLAVLYVAPGLALYAYDRVVRLRRSRLVPRELIGLRRRHVRGGVAVLQVQRDSLRFRPGQYCFLCVPAVSRLQWHPFSISSAPGASDITFHIKSMGAASWSGRVNGLAAQLAGEVASSRGNLSLRPLTFHDALEVKVDGPYGAGYALDGLQRRRHLLLLAGGIGVTPLASLLRGLLQADLAAAAAAAPGPPPAAVAGRSLRLVWVVAAPDQLLWFADLLAELQAAAAALPGRLQVDLHCSRQPPAASGSVRLPPHLVPLHRAPAHPDAADAAVDDLLDRLEGGEDLLYSHSFRDYSSFTQRLLADPAAAVPAEDASPASPAAPSSGSPSAPSSGSPSAPSSGGSGGPGSGSSGGAGSGSSGEATSSDEATSSGEATSSDEAWPAVQEAEAGLAEGGELGGGWAAWSGGRPDLAAVFREERRQAVRTALADAAADEVPDVDVWTLVCGPLALEREAAVLAYDLSCRAQHGDREAAFTFSFESLTFSL